MADNFTTLLVGVPRPISAGDIAFAACILLAGLFGFWTLYRILGPFRDEHKTK